MQYIVEREIFAHERYVFAKEREIFPHGEYVRIEGSPPPQVIQPQEEE